MKKIISLLLVFVLCISLVACGGNTTGNTQNQSSSQTNTPTQPTEPETTEPQIADLNTKDVNTVEDYCEYSLVTVYATNDVMPPKPSSFYTHYEAEAGSQYVVVIFDVKNLSSSSVSANSLLDATLEIASKEYSANVIVEEEDGASFGYSNTTSIASLDTQRLYYLFLVPAGADTANMTLTTQANSDTRAATISIAQFEDKIKSISIGETITDDDTISVVLDDVYYTEALYPPHASGYYHYFEAASGKTFLVVKMTAQNLKGTDLKYDAIAGVKCIYKEKYNYSSFAVLEEDGGSDLNNYPSQYSIAPLDKGVVYYLCEMPAEVKNGNVEISLYIAGTYYKYSIG